MDGVLSRLARDIELLRQDKRIKSIEQEDFVIHIQTNDLYFYTEDRKFKTYLGQLDITFDFQKTSIHAGWDLKNTNEKTGIVVDKFHQRRRAEATWITPMIFLYNGQTPAACLGGYSQALRLAWREQDLLQVVEIFFRFNESYDTTISNHGEDLWLTSQELIPV